MWPRLGYFRLCHSHMVFSHTKHIIVFPLEPSIYHVPAGMSQDWQEAELPVGPRCVFLRKLEYVTSGQEMQEEKDRSPGQSAWKVLEETECSHCVTDFVLPLVSFVLSLPKVAITTTWMVPFSPREEQ